MRLLIPLLALLGGCDIGKSCTLMFSPSTLDIDVEASAFEAGDWDIELEGDLLANCTVTLPELDATTHCDDTRVTLGLSEDGAAVESIGIMGDSPDTLVVTFLRDGTEVDSVELTPAYDEHEPNGPGCGVTRNGTESITLN